MRTADRFPVPLPASQGRERFDPERFDLERFVAAQAPVWPQVVRELREGRKRSHWMWFVFPQIEGLGRSETARRFALSSLHEARAYLAHPLLGPRLAEATDLALRIPDRSARDVFGSPDDLKLRSSLTLFDRAAPGQRFEQALRRFFAGPDTMTLERLMEHGT